MQKTISNFQFPTSKLKRDPAIRRGGKIGDWRLAIGPVRAFTLIELLTVITILGILAALTVPALKEMGKANVQASATRQMLDAVARARQLAISRHTSVYMVFVPANFWTNMDLTKLTYNQRQIVTNLAALQMTGYNYVSYGKVGDQPGQHQWAYLAEWDSLPDNSFIAGWKFGYGGWPYNFTIPSTSDAFSVYPFDYRNDIPFPTADTNLIAIAGTANNPSLPYIEFNYLGQLVSSASDRDPVGTGVDIPLAQGTVSYAYDAATKSPLLTPLNTAPGSTDIQEKPPGNSTGIGYTIIRVEPLTGRPEMLQFKMK